MRPFLLAATLIIAAYALTNEGFLSPPTPEEPPFHQEPQIGFANFTQHVIKLHYPVQTHTITTEDGYILTWFRIQAKYQENFKTGLPVVLCMHGVGDSGDTFVINDENDAIGLRLANEGYDVWVGNVRGTKYGLKHVNKKIKPRQFWDFTWQNMSTYDLPAGFEYINKVTGQNITYVGHSQGATIMFAAMCDEVPGVMKYLKHFVALSPVTFVSHLESGIMKLMANTTLAQTFISLHMYAFLQPDFFDSEMGHIFCVFYPTVCGNMLSNIYGYDPDYDNYEQINVILEHEPGGTSVFNMVHWEQLIHNGRFSKYDYGSEKENMRRYGQKTAPDYDLSKIKMPISMFFGTYDTIGVRKDTELLLNALDGAMVEQSFYKYYPADHCTWTWGKNIGFYFDDFLREINKN